MKKILLTLMVLMIVGCAVEEDTRLICKCLYTQNSPDNPFSSDMKFDCSDDEVTTLTINFKDKMFDLDNIYLGDKSQFIFNDHKIYTEQFNSEFYRAFDFNRISLSFEEKTGFIDTSDFDIDDPLDRAYPPFEEGRFLKTKYQCEIAKGI